MPAPWALASVDVLVTASIEPLEHGSITINGVLLLAIALACCKLDVRDVHPTISSTHSMA